MSALSAPTADLTIFDAVLSEVPLLITTEASNSRALIVGMIAEAIDAFEHGAFNEAILSNVAFLVTSITLDKPILRLFILLEVSHHPPSFLQVIKLLLFHLS